MSGCRFLPARELPEALVLRISTTVGQARLLKEESNDFLANRMAEMKERRYKIGLDREEAGRHLGPDRTNTALNMLLSIKNLKKFISYLSN